MGFFLSAWVIFGDCLSLLGWGTQFRLSLDRLDFISQNPWSLQVHFYWL